ncbi:uncharacterized protein [Amphiura filiformis]|uniref:uncharacterized protein n=1 Tax=Amphiura filiformis TaxID=82378 RepID=UPI003B21A5E6
MWVYHLTNRYNVVLTLQLLCILSENGIHVRAHVCAVGQERDKHNGWRWFLSDKDPCSCTSIRLGGFNAYSSERSFDTEYEKYVDIPWGGDGEDKIRNYYNLNCNDVNECDLRSDNCDENAVCINNDGSFTCACNVGYTGDGVTCSDVDECDLRSDNCDINANCSNNDGSFTCTCVAGYTGDGITCSDDDECDLNTDNCGENAVCSNNDGSFTCACNVGYTADGVTCSVCKDPLGMENGDIPDGHITASSEYGDINLVATQGRLGGNNAWSSAHQTGEEWIQADLGHPRYVTGVITQGDGGYNAPDWVKSFKVSTFLSTNDNEMFIMDQNGTVVRFPGNVDRVSEVTAMFPVPVFARIVRITCLEKYRADGYYQLRFELLGCKE